MGFYEILRKRRSIRAYRPDPVEEDKLDRVLEAARLAPSAANRQPVFFYVIRDKGTRERLFEAYPQKWFVEAPLIICGCSRPSEAWERRDEKNYADIDLTIAMDHLILAAAAEGLGTCWIGAFDPDQLRRILSIPVDLEPVAMTPLGYPVAQPEPTSRKETGDLVEFL